MNEVKIDTIPFPMRWEHATNMQKTEAGVVLVIACDNQTDLFVDPQGTSAIDNAPRLLFTPRSPFILSAKVTVDFNSTFDAGVLLIQVDVTRWAKLCFELTPEGVPAIVSVVNNGRSDDCNSNIIHEPWVYLRVSQLEGAFAFHYSLNARHWRLVRYFTLGAHEKVRSGFLAQAPIGSGCTARFSDISFEQRLLKDLRGGE